MGLARISAEPTRSVHTGRKQTSQVPGPPLYMRAVFIDPGGRSASHRDDTGRFAFASSYELGATDNPISGFILSAHMLAVYASWPTSPSSHATLASERRVRASRAGLSPAGQHHRISGFTTRVTPFIRSKLCLAHNWAWGCWSETGYVGRCGERKEGASGNWRAVG